MDVIGAHIRPHIARSTCIRLMFQAIVAKLHSPNSLDPHSAAVAHFDVNAVHVDNGVQRIEWAR